MATQNLRDGPVGSTLRALSVPMATGVVFMLAVNLIDTYWASQLGTDALAAMSFAFPVIGVVLNISLGLMIGVSVAVSRVVGSGDLAEGRQLATDSLWLGLGIVGVVTAIGLLTIDPVFTLLGAGPELLPAIHGYMQIWYLSAFFLVVPMMLNGVLRAHGDAMTARNVMILSAIFNGVLDPLLIFGAGPVPALGLQGAAAATGLSRAFAFVYALYVAHQAKTLAYTLPAATRFLDSTRTILRVGIPATLTNVLGPVATAVITAIVAFEGASAVAGYGIGARIDALLLIPPIALSSGLSPFIGQNWGANLPARVQEAFRVSVQFSVAWGGVAAVGMLFGAPYVAAVFSDDPAVVEATVTYLRIVPLGYAAYGALMMVSSAFNAVDHASRATVLSALRSLVLAVPFALAGSAFGLPGIFAGLGIASVLAALLALRWMRVFFAEAPRVEAASPTDAAFLLEGTAPEQRPATEALIAHLKRLGVELHRTRRNAVGFYVGDREVGHIHPSGHVDLPLPPPIGDLLVRRGELVHHRMAESGWYSHGLQTVEDTGFAEWVLSLATVLERMARVGEDEAVREGLAELALDEELLGHVGACGERWKQCAQWASAG